MFGHHFAAIAGPGPAGRARSSPRSSATCPGTLYILIGVVLGGAVQDFTILVGSMRRDGKSLGQMVREEIGPVGGAAALVGVLAIMVILIGVLGLVVVNAMFGSPWAHLDGRGDDPDRARDGRLHGARAARAACSRRASAASRWCCSRSSAGAGSTRARRCASFFDLDKRTLALALIVYGFVASVLPVWLLLAPRDYLSAFVKIGTVALLAVGLLVVQPAGAAARAHALRRRQRARSSRARSSRSASSRSPAARSRASTR